MVHLLTTKTINAKISIYNLCLPAACCAVGFRFVLFVIAVIVLPPPHPPPPPPHLATTFHSLSQSLAILLSNGNVAPFVCYYECYFGFGPFFYVKFVRGGGGGIEFLARIIKFYRSVYVGITMSVCLDLVRKISFELFSLLSVSYTHLTLPTRRGV